LNRLLLVKDGIGATSELVGEGRAFKAMQAPLPASLPTQTQETFLLWYDNRAREILFDSR